MLRHGLHKPAQQFLDQIENIVLLDEGHLHVELSELRLPVRPQILVTETPRDLVVAVVPRTHQDLLVDLRRLRQRVKTSRV